MSRFEIEPGDSISTLIAAIETHQLVDLVRERYPYVPDISTNNMFGIPIDGYLRLTRDRSILHDLENIFLKLQLVCIADHKHLIYNSWIPANFIVDSEKHIWILGLDFATIGSLDSMREDFQHRWRMTQMLYDTYICGQSPILPSDNPRPGERLIKVGDEKGLLKLFDDWIPK